VDAALAQTKKPANNYRSATARLTPADEAKVRTCYLVRGQSPKEIADALGLPIKPIHNLVSRRKWTKLRAGRWAEKSAEVEAAMVADAERVLHEAAFTSEELLTGSGELAREILANRDAKGLSMVSTAMRNFTEVANKLRGRDIQGQGGSSVNVSMFVLNTPPQREQREEKQAGKIPPVSANLNNSAAQITDVAAQRVS